MKKPRFSLSLANTPGRNLASHRYKCSGGPFSGQVITLNYHSDTAVFTARGQTGRYVGGNWEPAQC